MANVIYCFRSDFRLHDNPALTAACQRGATVIPVCFVPPDTATAWGFPRMSARVRAFRLEAARAVDVVLREQGSQLIPLLGNMTEALPNLVQKTAAEVVICEEIATPEEQHEINALRAQGIKVETYWQSSLFHPADLPFPVEKLPDVFTAFRQQIERQAITPRLPLVAPVVPPLPDDWCTDGAFDFSDTALPAIDHRSSFPFPAPEFQASESAALAHLVQYMARGLPHSYKATRNQLSGVDFSSKFSPWLACGALSPRTIVQALQTFETEYGKSESSYWLWFELLWRDYFRFLHLKYGSRLYHGGGLSRRAVPSHDPDNFQRWCSGETGEALVDAGMRELAATGYLSNRLRQVVASYLIYDLGCDWRAGAAWFESNLLDYDCYSNQGNWLYIAGLGTDPRGGRRFNPTKQAAEYDRDGAYRCRWLAEPSR